MPETARYSAKVVARAREHHAAGWSQRQIARLIAREFQVSAPASNTVRWWCDPEFRESKASYDRERKRRARPRTRGLVFTAGFKTERMLAWHAAGASFAAIAAVALVEWGDVFTVDQVRYRLLKEAT